MTLYKKVNNQYIEREILFRAKDFFTNEWVYGVPMLDSYVKGRWWMIEDVMVNEDMQASIKKSVIDPKTIGQFTGIYIGEAKLFEDDIIESQGSLYENEKSVLLVVKYLADKNNPAFDTPEYSYEPRENTLTALLQSLYHKLTIIGNIHDNPEKVEGKIRE